MKVTARADYAVRAALELAAANGETRKVADLATAQDIPPRFLENILLALRRVGLVQSRRGAEGGFRLARPADSITLADVLRAVEGPLAGVQGVRPDQLRYSGPAAGMTEVWVAVRASLRDVLEQVTLAQVVGGSLPSEVRQLLDDPQAWESS